MAKRLLNNCTLLFGDTHFPYEDKRFWTAIDEANKYYNFDRVIHTGDLLDQYNFSAYPKAPTAEPVNKELAKAKKCIASLGIIFPSMDIVSSNHDDRLYKAGTIAGIPKEIIRPYAEVIGAPKGWKWHKDLTITIDATREQLYIAHTKTGTTLGLSKAMGMSVAVGHKHNNFGIQYYNVNKKDRFAIDVGCNISDKGPPFDYNKGNLFRPLRGMWVILDGVPIPLKAKR